MTSNVASYAMISIQSIQKTAGTGVMRDDKGMVGPVSKSDLGVSQLLPLAEANPIAIIIFQA